MPDKVKKLNENCHTCGRQLTSWDAKCSKALAYKNKVCEHCIAKEYGMTVEEARSIIKHHFGLVPCLGI